MDTIPCRELEMEGELMYQPLDIKVTDIAWTQLPAGQVEMLISGGEPDLISRTIDGVEDRAICIGLVTPHCLLELDMSCVPNSLADSETVVDSWNVGSLFCTWK